MRYTEDEFDEILKVLIKKEVESVEVPPVDEQWKKFKQRYGIADTPGSRYLKKLKSKTFWAAAIVFIVIGISLFQPLTAAAFGERIMKIFYAVTGKTTQNIVISEKRSGDIPQIGDANISEPPREVSLEEAKKLINFLLAEPKFLPEGTKLEKIMFTQIHTDIFRVSMTYDKNGNKINLTQGNLFGDNSESYLFDSDDSQVKTMDLNGRSGHLIKNKDGSNTMIWHNRGLFFELESKIDQIELIKIAESID
ncbi:MAG: DUF4367 domain-containing protein [Caulobacteraceae bacterium]